jgi:hypothetical protein
MLCCLLYLCGAWLWSSSFVVNRVDFICCILFFIFYCIGYFLFHVYLCERGYLRLRGLEVMRICFWTKTFIYNDALVQVLRSWEWVKRIL